MAGMAEMGIGMMNKESRNAGIMEYGIRNPGRQEEWKRGKWNSGILE
jgi:hypothetical protein